MSLYNSRRAQYGGFTLIEVLVALAIFALCASVFTARSTSTLSNRQRIIEQQVALWIAKNRLAEIRTGIPETKIQSQDAYSRWQIHSSIDATASPKLKKVTVKISPRNQENPDQYNVAELVAYIAEAP